MEALPSRVRVAVFFWPEIVARTGLRNGIELPVEQCGAPMDGGVWVKCFDVPLRKNGVVVTENGKPVMKNEGYAPLHPGEYEVIE